jgi:hypothetical protein
MRITPELLLRNMRAFIRHHIVKFELATQRREAEEAGGEEDQGVFAKLLVFVCVCVCGERG